MAVFNLGSINVDHFYNVLHLPEPGETLTAVGHATGLGGKGANQSVAVAKAGAKVRHIGTVGPDGDLVRDRLAALGVDVTYVATGKAVTGHANIYVDRQGENCIIVLPGANHEQTLTNLDMALSGAVAGDYFMLQNEVTLKAEAAERARKLGLFVVYSAAPFKPEAVEEMLPHVDLLVLNQVEAEQLSATLGLPIDEIPVPNLLITRGAKGAVWRDHENGGEVSVSAFPVEPVDTSGAGDCFIGYVVAGLSQGLDIAGAMQIGTAAAALKVTRPGTADAIPTRAEVDAFLAGLETK